MFVLVFFVLTALASSSFGVAVSQTHEKQNKKELPAHMMHTPYGPRLRRCVHEVPSGTHIHRLANGDHR